MRKAFVSHERFDERGIAAKAAKEDVLAVCVEIIQFEQSCIVSAASVVWCVQSTYLSTSSIQALTGCQRR